MQTRQAHPLPLCFQIFGAEWESASQATGDINLRFIPDQGQPVTANKVYSGGQTGESIIMHDHRSCTVRTVGWLLLHCSRHFADAFDCWALLDYSCTRQARPVLDLRLTYTRLFHHSTLPQEGQTFAGMLYYAGLMPTKVQFPSLSGSSSGASASSGGASASSGNGQVHILSVPLFTTFSNIRGCLIDRGSRDDGLTFCCYPGFLDDVS